MTTPARRAEADRVEEVYAWALAQLGESMYDDALKQWERVPKTGQARTAGWWLSEMLDLVMARRSEARDLALTYYRLIRALRVGRTIPDPVRGETGTVSLEVLRDQFLAEVEAVSGQAQPSPSYEDSEYEIDLLIDIEDLGFDLDELADQHDETAAQEAAELLDELGIEAFLTNLDAITAKPDQEQTDRDNAVDEAHEQAGRNQAAVAERISMNAARGLTYNLAAYDGEVLGWVRYSRTGSPCGFCAMLLSRAVFYKTAKMAQHQGAKQEENKFHDNCQCVSVPVFTHDQFANSDLFELNRYYRLMWANNIAGKYGGNKALNKFRNLVTKDNARREAQAAA